MAAVVCGAAEFFFVLVVCPGKGGVGDLEARVFAVVADSFLSVDVLSRAGRNVMGDDRLWLNRGTHENYQIKKPHLFLCFSCFILRSDFSFQDPVKIRL